MAFLTDDFWSQLPFRAQGPPPPPPMQDDSGSPLDTPEEVLHKTEVDRKVKQSAQDQLRDWANQGPPPLPKPSVWRRLAAGALAGGAGYLNASAGRPGGISRPVDVQAGVRGIMGDTDYERNTRAWQLKGKGLEDAAQQERYEQDRIERGREADERSRLTAAQIAREEALTADLNAQRRARADELAAQAAERRTKNLQRYQTYEPTAELTPKPIASPSGPPIPAGLSVVPQASADSLPSLPLRNRGITVPAPPPPGYVAADRPEGGDPTKQYALPTLEQEDRMKRGVRPVPADLKPYLPFDEASEAEIRDAVKKKNDDERQDTRLAAADERQQRSLQAQERNLSTRESAAADRARDLEVFRTNLQNDLQDSIDARAARGIYSKAVSDIQKQAETELARVDQEYAGYAKKDRTSWWGLSGTPQGQNNEAEKASKAARIAEINQRKADALKAAEEAFAPYKNGAPGPSPSKTPPKGRTAPPPPGGGPQTMNGHSVGDEVTLKGGKKVKIKSFNSDGTFNY